MGEMKRWVKKKKRQEWLLGNGGPVCCDFSRGLGQTPEKQIRGRWEKESLILLDPGPGDKRKEWSNHEKDYHESLI